MRLSNCTRPSRWFAGALVVALLVGCTTSPSPGSEGPSAAASPIIGSGSEDTCSPIDLRSPTGERIDLTGTWEGGLFVHHVRQVLDCVWWIGYARWPGTEPGELATLTFFGRLASDFTLSGNWTTIVRPSGPSAYYDGPQEGDVAFTIRFDRDTGRATILTRVGAGTTNAEYPADELSLVGPLPDSANPPQQ
jgi:hypothetical protein